MGESLTESLLEAHRVPDRERAGRGSRDGRLLLRADHVVGEARSGALALRLFETVGLDRVACELALVGSEEDPLGRLELAEEQVGLERRARRRGVVVSRAGNGVSHQVYTARFGAPGRLVLDTGRGLSSCGGLGALSLTVTAAEAAAALAGAPLELPSPEVSLVRLFGKPPGWLSGEDVALELERRLAFAPPRGQVLEFVPIESGALPLADRLAIAARARALGALAAMFPSDEATRAFLRAQGREADWRPLLPSEVGRDAPGLDLDFSDLEPLVTSAGRGPVLRLRELGESRVSAVWIGPEATLADLERLGRAWSGARVADGVECLVSLGSRQLHESAARAGLLAVLRAAGARIGVRRSSVPRPRAEGGVALACGVPGARSEGWRETGVAACAAAALAGSVVDPRQLAASAPDDSDASSGESYVVDDRLLLRPPTDGGTGGDEGREGPALPVAPGIEGPLRGTVLIRLGDHVSVDRILPWGARVRPASQDFERLARYAFAGLEADFATRARAQGEGWVVAGHGLGGGEPREEAALVSLALGIRGMLALSFEPRFRRLLHLHGLLTLRLGAEGDAAAMARGDELEIPDLPDGLEPGKPLVVRNLTQGFQVAVHHDLDAAGVREARAGGLLATLRRVPRAAA
jgi:aconitate hydratase